MRQKPQGTREGFRWPATLTYVTALPLRTKRPCLFLVSYFPPIKLVCEATVNNGFWEDKKKVVKTFLACFHLRPRWILFMDLYLHWMSPYMRIKKSRKVWAKLSFNIWCVPTPSHSNWIMINYSQACFTYCKNKRNLLTVLFSKPEIDTKHYFECVFCRD